jgi:hypothetical protein
VVVEALVVTEQRQDYPLRLVQHTQLLWVLAGLEVYIHLQQLAIAVLILFLVL